MTNFKVLVTSPEDQDRLIKALRKIYPHIYISFDHSPKKKKVVHVIDGLETNWNIIERAFRDVNSYLILKSISEVEDMGVALVSEAEYMVEDIPRKIRKSFPVRFKAVAFAKSNIGEFTITKRIITKEKK